MFRWALRSNHNDGLKGLRTQDTTSNPSQGSTSLIYTMNTTTGLSDFLARPVKRAIGTLADDAMAEQKRMATDRSRVNLQAQERM